MYDRYDILVEIKDNDIQWIPSDQQHVQDTINAFPGWWKEHPADGVGVKYYQNSDGQAQILSRSISINLRADLYKVTNPVVKFEADGTLFINPNATR